MNTTINNQLNEGIFVPDHLDPAPVVKYCTSCKTELVINTDIHFTSFGLELCEDCLYT